MSIAIYCATSTRLQEAQQLADAYEWPIFTSQEAYQHHASSYDCILLLTPDYLGLQLAKEKKPFYLDFLSKKMRYRLKHPQLSKERLARVMGLSPAQHPYIIDATAGLGRDSFVLAALGYTVTLLERSPLIHALLKDALHRAQQDPAIAPISARLHLIQADALTWLKQLKQDRTQTPLPDIIYLDPMFPTRKKSASVKKEMILLQNLIGEDADAAALFQMALTCATKRIVVKRPRLAPTITEQNPNYTVIGKSGRFDVYLTA